jgi:hypothetical protein
LVRQWFDSLLPSQSAIRNVLDHQITRSPDNPILRAARFLQAGANPAFRNRQSKIRNVLDHPITRFF